MKNCQKSTFLKWTNGLFIYNYKVATLSTFDLTVIGITLPILQSIGQMLTFQILWIKKDKSCYEKNDSSYRIDLLLRSSIAVFFFYFTDKKNILLFCSKL